VGGARSTPAQAPHADARQRCVGCAGSDDPMTSNLVLEARPGFGGAAAAVGCRRRRAPDRLTSMPSLVSTNGVWPSLTAQARWLTRRSRQPSAPTAGPGLAWNRFPSTAASIFIASPPRNGLSADHGDLSTATTAFHRRGEHHLDRTPLLPSWSTSLQCRRAARFPAVNGQQASRPCCWPKLDRSRAVDSALALA